MKTIKPDETRSRADVVRMLRESSFHRHGTDSIYVIAYALGIEVDGSHIDEVSSLVFKRLANLIEKPDLYTCEFVPTSFRVAYDEEDRAITYGEPSDDCDSFSCSRCGYELMYEKGGSYSWFTDSYPYKPNGLRWCPGCGAIVHFPWSWLDKKEVE